MPTTPDNYTPNSRQINLWLTAPNVHAYMDRRQIPVDWSSISEATIDLSRELVRESRWTPPSEPAFPLDVVNIPNGRYTLQDDDGNTVFYQIYTVQSGQWAGRRVIKRKSGGRYSAFAFLNADGGWTLWSRFRNQEQEPFVALTPLLLETIQRTYVMRAGVVEAGDRAYRFPSSHLTVTTHDCRICNHPVQSFSLQLCTSHHPVTASATAENDLASSLVFDRLDDEEQQPAVERTIPLAYCEVTTVEVQ